MTTNTARLKSIKNLTSLSNISLTPCNCSRLPVTKQRLANMESGSSSNLGVCGPSKAHNELDRDLGLWMVDVYNPSLPMVGGDKNFP
jgi:hypothetical protein